MATAAITATAKPPMPAFTPLADPGFVVELELEGAPSLVAVPLGLPEIVAVPTVTPVAFVHEPASAAVLEKVISAQLKRPPVGSPLVMTWMVALVPSVTLMEDGSERPVMQKAPRPVWRKVGRMTVLKALPGLFPTAMRTSTLDWECPIFSAICPPDIGHAVRAVEGVLKPPQGNWSRVSSLKSRALGNSRVKWAEVSEAIARREVIVYFMLRVRVRMRDVLCGIGVWCICEPLNWRVGVIGIVFVCLFAGGNDRMVWMD